MHRFRNALCAATALALAITGSVAIAQSSSDVQFERGTTSTTIESTINGDQYRDYVVRANAGQTMRVTKSGARIVYFKVLAPGSNDAAIFTGSSEGNTFAGTLSRSGAYKIRVYQMRSTARRGERGPFTLTIAVTGSGSATQMPNEPSTPATGHGIHGLGGMNSINAIDIMAERGFANVDSFSSGDTEYGIFYNRDLRICAQMTMSGGKVVSVDDIHSHPKCR